MKANRERKINVNTDWGNKTAKVKVECGDGKSRPSASSTPEQCCGSRSRDYPSPSSSASQTSLTLSTTLSLPPTCQPHHTLSSAASLYLSSLSQYLYSHSPVPTILTASSTLPTHLRLTPAAPTCPPHPQPPSAAFPLHTSLIHPPTP